MRVRLYTDGGAGAEIYFDNATLKVAASRATMGTCIEQDSSSVSIVYNSNVSGLSGVSQTPPTGIEFDPEAVYRVQARVRQSRRAPNGYEALTIGLVGYDELGTEVGYDGTAVATKRYKVSAAAEAMTAYAEGEWILFTGWVAGWGVTVGDSAFPYRDASTPAKLHPNVRQIVPFVQPNVKTTPGPGAGDGAVQIDLVRIDVYDRDALARVYGTLSKNAGRLKAGTRIEMSDGSSEPVVKAMRKGVAQDGDAITFVPPFPTAVVPEVSFVPVNTKTYHKDIT